MVRWLNNRQILVPRRTEMALALALVVEALVVEALAEAAPRGAVARTATGIAIGTGTAAVGQEARADKAAQMAGVGAGGVPLVAAPAVVAVARPRIGGSRGHVLAAAVGVAVSRPGPVADHRIVTGIVRGDLVRSHWRPMCWHP